MKKQVLSAFLALGFLAGGTLVPSGQAEAALVSDQRIEDQRQVVVEHTNAALQEEIKLVQLRLIQILERRINEIADTIDN